jgi:NADPH-dependent ferric siderophore reductase
VVVVAEKKQRTTGKRKPRKKEAELPTAAPEAAASPGSPFAKKLVWGNALAMVGTPHSPSSPAPPRTAAVAATSETSAPAPAAAAASTPNGTNGTNGTNGVNGMNGHGHTVTTPSYAAHPALMKFHKHQQERTLLNNAAAASPTQVMPTNAAATTTTTTAQLFRTP